MTGYLARLAARAGGEPSAAAPRLPSRFEPVGGPAAGAGAPGGAVRAVPLASRRTGADELPVAPGAIRAASIHRARPDDVARSGPAEDRGARRATSSERVASAEPFPAVAVAATVSASPRSSDRAVPAAREVGAASTASAVAPAGPSLADARAPDLGAAPGLPPRAAPGLPPRAEASPRPLPAPAPTHSHPGDRSSTGGAERDDRPDVVHVTIDRVEVRATIAAPATARTASDDSARLDPSVSLHEYLSGRSR